MSAMSTFASEAKANLANDKQIPGSELEKAFALVDNGQHCSPEPPPVTTTILPANGKSPTTMTAVVLLVWIKAVDQTYRL